MENSCNTKYPLLLVHGIGFRDWKHPCYWGRIPRELERRGARIYYGRQDAWGSLAHNTETVARSLERALEDSGSPKVNIIAHSKGGLEARYLVTELGKRANVASITTVSTPHHGSKTMDWLMRFPAPLVRLVAFPVNLWFRLLGDRRPDFYLVCRQLTTSWMEAFNRTHPDPPGIYVQSFATAMARPWSDMIMCLTSFVVGLADGENDGIVGTFSMEWGRFRGVWRGATGRGISHPDAVDYRRRNFTKKSKTGHISDVRQPYIQIVSELREMGL